jgi:protein SCO1/2
MNFKVLILGLIALLFGTYLQIFGLNLPGNNLTQQDPQIDGFFWPNQKQLGDFELVGTQDQKFNLDKLKGSWSFVFFGYTHCPDICPITMNTLRQVRDSLANGSESASSSPQFVFVSVDGERDTPEVMNSYVSYFGEGFIGASGNKTQVDTLTGQLGVPYSIDEHQPGDKNYLVGHSGSVFLISPDANLAAILHAPQDAADVADRFSQILKFSNGKS